MSITLDKAWEAKKYEDELIAAWEASGFFNPDHLPGAADKKPYAIMMPPPNVTGILHLGHAMENALMDTMARYQRMRGKKVLLLPGTDHAAVATQARVEANLMKERGIANPRQQLGREGLLAEVRAYAEQSKSTIIGQIKKLGTSCDWDRLAYTFDDVRSKAVNTMFKRMYDDGLIYRGYRTVNWSVKGQSTCSDDELVYIERPATLYTFKYSADFPIAIATTRPETKLGDTAVAVHPDDVRYQKYIDQTLTVDIGAAAPLQIKIIARTDVDPNFGTGALGVTPAHSQIDFAMYESQKAAGDAIGIVAVIGNDGKMTAAAGLNYVGLTVEEARAKFVDYLKANNLLISEEETIQNVGTSDRFGDVVEVVPMTQWWVDVNKTIHGRGKSLKDLMREAVTTGLGGDGSKKITITPDRFTQSYLSWIEHLRDWCISRQIWWGHRIPVWYRTRDQGLGTRDKEETVVSDIQPDGDGWVQDEDTLDTWFSAGLWTFSTLGWPNQTKDLETYHPTAWMQMGYELVFFWLARMILMSTYALNDIPFKQVYIHGIVRAADGRKFSKSLGNGRDPLELIEQYGTDALRLSLLAGIAPGNDTRFYDEKITGARNFVNKLWNVARFILQSVDTVELVNSEPAAKTFADEWILLELRSVTALVTESMERTEFSYACEKLREFTWDYFADWYLEIAKVEKEKDEILLYVLQNLLKLWHPFLPFVTEAIWKNFASQELLLIQAWPASVSGEESSANQKLNEQAGVFVEIVKTLRNLRSENNIAAAKKVNVIINAGSQAQFITEQSNVISALVRAETLTLTEQKPTEPALTAMVGEVEVYILAEAVDADKERTRLSAELEQLTKYISVQEIKLSNEEFTAKAPAAVIAKEKAKLAEAQVAIESLQKQLVALEK